MSDNVNVQDVLNRVYSHMYSPELEVNDGNREMFRKYCLFVNAFEAALKLMNQEQLNQLN